MFKFKEEFLKSLNEILDQREEALKANFEANYTHIDEATDKDLLNDIENIKEVINQSELEYFNCAEFVTQDEILSTHSKEELVTRIKELEDDTKELEDETKELRSRLLTIENFLIETLKGFKDA